MPGDYGALGFWVGKQRERCPDDEKVARLDSIGFEWDGRVSRSRNTWRVGEAHALEYFEKQGNLKVPAGFKCSDGYKLGNFVKKAKADGRFEELEKSVKKLKRMGEDKPQKRYVRKYIKFQNGD